MNVTVPTEPSGRLAAFGNQLIEIHLWLREELARLTDHVDGYLDGAQPLASERPVAGERPVAAERLRGLGSSGFGAHCLAFCSMLRRHHTGEDGGAFSVLAGRFPELRPVIDELERDHRMVADILRRLEDLLGGLGLGLGLDGLGVDGLGAGGLRVEGLAPGEPADPDGAGPGVPDPGMARRVRAELSGLTALLESHFTYEERRLVAALNSLEADAGTTEDLLGIPLPTQ
ncbi:MAG TPA: hemerythrin domain-containing protein [Rugosimonospora sp.]